MNIKKKFTQIFYLLTDEHEDIDILIDKLQLLHDNQIISKELLLNLIKALVFIINFNNLKISIYTSIFNENLENKILKLFNNFNYSYQFKLSERRINEIIYITDLFITKCFNSNFNSIKYLSFLNKVIRKISNLNISFKSKINIYCIYLNQILKYIDGGICFENKLDELVIIIKRIDKFIK